MPRSWSLRQGRAGFGFHLNGVAAGNRSWTDSGCPANNLEGMTARQLDGHTAIDIHVPWESHEWSRRHDLVEDSKIVAPGEGLQPDGHTAIDIRVPRERHEWPRSHVLVEDSKIVAPVRATVPAFCCDRRLDRIARNGAHCSIPASWLAPNGREDTTLSRTPRSWHLALSLRSALA